MKDVKMLNEIIKAHPQFAKKSLLYDEIAKTIDCSPEKAKQLAATHCNMISFYAILSASGTFFGSYSEFFRWMLTHGFCNIQGRILVDKSTICDELGITLPLLKSKEIEDVANPIRLNPDKFYQIKIKGNTSGDHFMAGYVDGKVFRLSDTSYRGIGAKATDHITTKNFQWIMEC